MRRMPSSSISPISRPTVLTSELVTEAVRLLREDSRAARLAAAQLLARGWALDEEARLAALPPEALLPPDGGEE